MTACLECGIPDCPGGHRHDLAETLGEVLDLGDRLTEASLVRNATTTEGPPS